MLYEIKDRWSAKVLFSHECGSLKEAILEAARTRADLSRADLYGANLSRANLSGAIGVNKFLSTPLLLLKDQPGPMRLFKLVTEAGVGPYNGGITYEVGKSYEVADAETDDTIHCAAGINLATLDWCIKEWNPGYRILIAEFAAADIASIPTCTDGKIRVHRCTIVGEKDLTEIGLIEAPKDVTPATADR